MENNSGLQILIEAIQKQSMEVFGSRRKMGGEEGSAKYREQLEGELDELYGHYRVFGGKL